MRRRGCATHACARAGSTRARTLASGAWPRAFPPRGMSGAPPDPSREGAEPSADDEVSRLLALDVTPTSELAAVAAARGLRDASTRARAWPKLLALDVTRADASAALFEGRATALNARERNQVELDVRRCHWIPASAGPERRARLSRVIRGVLATHPGECRYYQGMHDVAAVLLLVCGDAAPAVLDRLVVGHLRDAARGSGLDAVLETLRLLPHLIAVADPELHAAVFPASTRSPFAESKRDPPNVNVTAKDPTIGEGSDDAAAEVRDARRTANGADERTTTTTKEHSNEARSSRPSRAKGRPKGCPEKNERDDSNDSNDSDSNDSDSNDSNDSFELLSVADFSEMEHVGTCHFAVSWLLTWFAHSLEDLDDVSRLFDAFLGSDPLMPLYVGAAAVVADRETLLAMARGEMDETGAFVVEAEEGDVPSPRDERGAKEKKKKNGRRAMNRAEDWPLIEGMLHARLSALPALKTQTSSNDVVRLRWKVVESAGADGGFRATVKAGLFVESAATRDSRETKDRKGWGVEAVLRSASMLHARLPPRALYTVLGTEPDPFSAFAAYPYPWLAMSRWGFGAEGVADFAGGERTKTDESVAPAPDAAEGGGDARAPFRLGEGASATALFAQRLGANIRRGVRRGVSELKKMENSDHARGLRGFLGGAFASGAANDAVPRLND